MTPALVLVDGWKSPALALPSLVAISICFPVMMRSVACRALDIGTRRSGKPFPEPDVQDFVRTAAVFVTAWRTPPYERPAPPADSDSLCRTGRHCGRGSRRPGKARREGRGHG